MKERAFSDAVGLRTDRDRLAKIFLKPGAWRRRASVRVVDSLLRLFIRSPKAHAPESLRKGDVKCVLVFDSGALGDMVLLAPFLRSLRGYLPNAQIVLVGRGAASSLLIEQGLVNESVVVCVPWPRSKRGSARPLLLCWLDFVREMLRLRTRQFDIGFSCGWSGDLFGNFAIWLSGARRRIGYGYAGGDYSLTDVVEPDLARPHILDRNLQLLEHIGVPVVPHEEALAIDQEEANAALELLEQRGVGTEELVIGIHAGAGSGLREWGDERFGAVGRWAADRFGAKILWFSDPGKPKPLPSNLDDAIPLGLRLTQFMAVLARCQLFICNDSGPMHVAAAMKVPVVAVFGPQRPEWFGPYGDWHRVVIRHDIWCRPCGDRCIWEEPHCLRLISVERVVEEVGEALKSVAPTSSRGGPPKVAVEAS
jgi:heptosyltransferase II